MENFRVPQTPSITYRTPKQKSAKAPRPVSTQAVKPRSPLMAKQLPMLDDTCKFLLIYKLIGAAGLYINIFFNLSLRTTI